jgi:hypothetical protein
VERVIFSKSWAMPSAWTFTIKPIKELNIRERFGGIGRLFDLSEREDDPYDRKETC